MTNNLPHKCFKLKRIATKKCFYIPPYSVLKKYLKMPNAEKKKYISIFLKKHNLKKKNLRIFTLLYTFNISDEIPLTLSEKNIYEIVHYKLL